MLESAVVIALMEVVEAHALPVVGAWLASELLGVSKKTKYNGIIHLAFGLLRAVGKELVQDGQGEYVVKTPPKVPTVAPAPPESAEAPEPPEEATDAPETPRPAVKAKTVTTKRKAPTTTRKRSTTTRAKGASGVVKRTPRTKAK